MRFRGVSSFDVLVACYDWGFRPRAGFIEGFAHKLASRGWVALLVNRPIWADRWRCGFSGGIWGFRKFRFRDSRSNLRGAGWAQTRPRCPRLRGGRQPAPFRDGRQPAFVSGEKKGLAAAPRPSGKGTSEYWDPELATLFSEDFLSPETNVRLCFQPGPQNFWGNRWSQPGET